MADTDNMGDGVAEDVDGTETDDIDDGVAEDFGGADNDDIDDGVLFCLEVALTCPSFFFSF